MTLLWLPVRFEPRPQSFPGFLDRLLGTVFEHYSKQMEHVYIYENLPEQCEVLSMMHLTNWPSMLGELVHGDRMRVCESFNIEQLGSAKLTRHLTQKM